MKINIYKISALALLAIFFFVSFWTACDKVDNPYIIHKEPVGDPFSSDSVKKVLVEDYTGIRCPNCPKAAKLAHDMATANNQRVIVLGIHASTLAEPIPPETTLDLRTEAGNEYYNHYGKPPLPMGVINKKKNNQGDYLYKTSEWETVVKEELSKDLSVRLKIEASLSEINNTIQAKIKYEAIEDLPFEHKLLVYLVEDGIIGDQKNSDSEVGSVPIIEGYVHHNVFRETLNTTWGQSIGSLTGGEEKTVEITYKITTEKYEESTYKLIAIIYRTSDEYIEQVEEFSFQPEEEE